MGSRYLSNLNCIQAISQNIKLSTKKNTKKTKKKKHNI